MSSDILPILSRGFLTITCAEPPAQRTQHMPGWDRILICVRTLSIPASKRPKREEEHPAKAAGAIFAFYSPRPPL